jgi:enoyl-CoA hydratase
VLDIERRSGVVVIKVQHGKVNALDLELLHAITATIRGAAEEQGVVLTGVGRAFCAGVDLRRIADGGALYLREFLPALSETFMTIFDYPRPIIAAVNGHAIAGGCVIAAACDVRLMSQGTIGLAELAVGVAFPTSALEILRHAVGPFVSRLVLTGELLDAARAQSVGLIDFVEAPEAIVDSAVHRARKLAQVPAEVFTFSKRQLQRQARERIATLRAEDDAAVVDLWSSTGVQAAISGYLQSLDQRPGHTQGAPV